jgi:hypothetical protein
VLGRESKGKRQLSVYQSDSGLREPQDDEMLYTHRRLSTCSLKTVFGTIEIVRVGYSHAGANSIYPLDAALALPASVFSYELQRRFVQAAVQGTFQESIDVSPTSPACRFPSTAWKNYW